MPLFGNMAAAAEITGRIMVAAIIVLLLVVIFVLFLHLYAKWFWWRTAEDGNAATIRRRFEFTPGQETAGAAQISVKRGLDKSLLRSMDVVMFKAVDCKDGLECAVCLCEVVEGDKARMLPKCNHVFHVGCIDMWFESHSTCPLCRNPVQDESKSGVEIVELEEDEIGNVINVASDVIRSESRSYPTNVLFWGNEVQVSSGASVVEEGSNIGLNVRSGEMLDLDVARRVLENVASSSLPSGMRFSEEEQKLPLTTRLRTLKRLLSRERRVIPSGSSSLDVELGTRRLGGSSIQNAIQ